MPKQFRRVVTGHNMEGNSCILFDGITENVRIPSDEPKVAMTDFWYSDECPETNAENVDVANRPIILQPPKNGSLFRIVELPPDHERTFGNLKAIDADGDTLEQGKRHPAFHKTKTLDYIFVLEGEIYCMLDDGEVCLKQGDVLIQRGTSHAWSNRSKNRCLLLATMLDAKPL